MAEAAGLKVHTSTSPHLVRFNERIRLAGVLITDETLVGYLERVEAALLGSREITHFEAAQAASFLAFSEVPADLLVLEVGLGGRFDASNVIEEAACSVFCPIDLDHQQFLGNTIEKIARDKAGILKAGCPAVSAIQGPEAKAEILAEAEKLGCDVSFLDEAEIAAVFLVLFLSDGRDVPKIWDDDAKHYAWTTSAFDVFVLVVVRALLVWAQVCGTKEVQSVVLQGTQFAAPVLLSV